VLQEDEEEVSQEDDEVPQEDDEEAIKYSLNLIFLYVIYLKTCRRFHGGASGIPSAGRRWWTSGAPPSGRRHTTLARRERCLMMTGVPHYQGNLTLNQYAQRWVREFIYLF
jgi:hypothetical protein